MLFYKLVKTLENDSINLIDWFSKNLMKANPNKFQAIAIGPKTNRHNFMLPDSDYSLKVKGLVNGKLS
jgi:hypothetical protein